MSVILLLSTPAQGVSWGVLIFSCSISVPTYGLIEILLVPPECMNDTCGRQGLMWTRRRPNPLGPQRGFSPWGIWCLPLGVSPAFCGQ